MNDPIASLIELSREVGRDPGLVLAGGGNTSVKVGDTLHVKASGCALATLTADDLVALDRARLAELAEADLGEDPELREARYKQALRAARLHHEREQRASVEALLHHLTPGRFVVHSHATLVNMLTCCTQGEALTRQWFGDAVLWVPYVDPGFTLAQRLRQALASHPTPRAIFLANHGLIVGGDSPEAVRDTTAWVLDTIRHHLARLAPTTEPDTSRRHPRAETLINLIAPALRALLAEDARLQVVTVDDGPAALSLCGHAEGRDVAMGGPLTPDQIVYCHSFPLWIAPQSEEAADLVAQLRQAIEAHRSNGGHAPKVVLVEGVGLFAAGRDAAAAAMTRDVYLDAIEVMTGARRLGGVRYLEPEARRFIEQWEVEAYRRKVSAGAGAVGHVAGKVALVTGAAQGFGLEIAEHFAREGGHVVLTDLNVEGARQAAQRLCAELGSGRALALAINVTDPASVASCLHQAVRAYGGLDVLISNAGVLKAGSVKTQPLKDFQFVTNVNYTGYFVCVQAAAPIMAVQHLADPRVWTDIIQINSKSGLQGSNKNGAYAGSKFGGIGLTQSFALELVEDGIKVNAICPGNFFDGPLWSDPEKGLFVQYLRTGKVPGARTIADVKRFYEEKVPMRRGCTTPDVMKAIYYLIEQAYETGQAVPVTGGQVMLS